MAIIGNLFSAELRRVSDATVYRLGSLTIQHSYGDPYPTIRCSVLDDENVLDPTAIQFGELMRLTATIYTVGNPPEVRKVFAYDAIIAQAGVGEDVGGISSSITLAPRASMIGYKMGTFDGLSSSLESSAKGLIQAIVNAYNAENAQLQVASVEFLPKDFIPIAAPRFLNMSMLDMVRQIAGERGLHVAIGFDNKLRVFSYLGSNTGSTTRTLAIDKFEQTDLTTDLMTKFMR